MSNDFLDQRGDYHSLIAFKRTISPIAFSRLATGR